MCNIFVTQTVHNWHYGSVDRHIIQKTDCTDAHLTLIVTNQNWCCNTAFKWLLSPAVVFYHTILTPEHKHSQVINFKSINFSFVASVAMAQLNDAKHWTAKEFDISLLSTLFYEIIWCDTIAALEVTEVVWPEWWSIWHIQTPTEL